MRSTLNEPSPAVWEQLAPLLDEAMASLGELDRNALALRFFENKTAQEIGRTLKLNEDAAHKRVARAIEKLRKFFTKRGVALSSAAIAGAISANSVHAAPMTLAKSVTAVAIAKGAAASISTLTLIKGALKVMAWTKVKTAIVIGAAVVLTVGTTTAIIIYRHQTPSILSSTKELSDSENAQYASLTGMTPEQAARKLLEACTQENWMETEKFLPPGLLTQHPSFGATFKNTYGGLEIVSLGHPFKSQVIIQAGLTYPGMFVPYKIRLKSGAIKKLQLAIRCDNPGKHWYFDGGM